MKTELTRRAMLASSVGLTGARGARRRAREPRRQTEVLSHESIDD